MPLNVNISPEYVHINSHYQVKNLENSCAIIGLMCKKYRTISAIRQRQQIIKALVHLYETRANYCLVLQRAFSRTSAANWVYSEPS